MNFTRGVDPKISLSLGIFEKLPKMMENSGYDYEDFLEVWEWALEKKKNFLFSYLASFQDKKWINGELVNLSNYNNELLWCSIESKNEEAVKILLNKPNLFKKESFTLELGSSEIEWEFIERGDTKTNLKETNFGVYLNLSITHHPNKKIETMLREYYSKYSQK